MQGSISEQVAEILKQLQQLVGGVLEDSQHLRGHHVVHNKEGWLREIQTGEWKFRETQQIIL